MARPLPPTRVIGIGAIQNGDIIRVSTDEFGIVTHKTARVDRRIHTGRLTHFLTAEKGIILELKDSSPINKVKITLLVRTPAPTLF